MYQNGKFTALTNKKEASFLQFNIHSKLFSAFKSKIFEFLVTLSVFYVTKSEKISF